MQILAHDHHAQPGRADVLLRAGIDQAELRPTSIGRDRMVEDMSATSGTAPTRGT